MAITLCTKLISDNIDTICANPMYKGIEQVGYIMNKSEVSSFTKSGNAVSALTLASQKKAFKIYNTGSAPFTGTTTTMAAGTVRNMFDKTVKFVVLNDGIDVTEDVIDQLANGEFVVVIEHKWANTAGDNKFEIVGLETGAKATEITKDAYSDDTLGGYSVTLTESGAPSSAVFFFATDVATTRAALEALC